MDLISFSRIASDISDALHKEKVILSTRHYKKLQRDFLWNIYQPSVNHSSNNVNNNQVLDVHTKPKNRRKNKNKKKIPRKPAQHHRRDSAKGQIPKAEDMSLDLMKDTVVNVTDKELSKKQLFAFYLSHKFAPTPSLPDLSQFENDLQTFFSKLRA